jgi:hypothetical protein
VTDSLTAQFSDFDMPDTFAATRHHAFTFKGTHSITANCNDCPDMFNSIGHDESSRRSVAAWVKKHEAGE